MHIYILYMYIYITSGAMTRTYVGHDSGAAMYVSACCLCVRMLLHTVAMASTYVGNDSFCPVTSAASTYLLHEMQDQ